MRLVQLLAKMELAMTIRLSCILLVILCGPRGLGGFCVMPVTTMCVLNGSLQAWRSAELPTKRRGGYPPALLRHRFAQNYLPLQEVAEGMDGAVCTINACRRRCMTVPVILLRPERTYSGQSLASIF